MKVILVNDDHKQQHLTQNHRKKIGDIPVIE